MTSEIKNHGIPMELVRDAVTRTLKSRIEEINRKSNGIYESMKYFEKKYGLKTEEFYKKFVRGNLETTWISLNGRHLRRYIMN